MLDHNTVGIGGLALLLIVREVLSYQRRRRTNNIDWIRMRDEIRQLYDWHDSRETDWKVLREQVKDMHEWHAVKDSDGLPVWYVRKNLETVINALSENIKRQTDALVAIQQNCQLNRQAILQVGHDVEKLGNAKRQGGER